MAKKTFKSIKVKSKTFKERTIKITRKAKGGKRGKT